MGSGPRKVDLVGLEEACRILLVSIGEDPSREGLAATPGRWARWWSEFLVAPASNDTAFASTIDQMVCVTGIRVWSICEHHLLPFWADAGIGYVPRGKLLGLSKFARIARRVAAGLRTQETLAAAIADEIEKATGTWDVAVLLQGRHLCMEMRGVRAQALMTTSVLRGVFRESATARGEFLAFAAGQGPRV